MGDVVPTLALTIVIHEAGINAAANSDQVATLVPEHERDRGDECQ